MFIDRDRELEALDKRYRSRRAEFLVLYGRRQLLCFFRNRKPRA